MKYLVLILLLFSCGKDDDSQNQTREVFISTEYNAFPCQECLLIELNEASINLFFERDEDIHSCPLGTYSFKNLDDEDLKVPQDQNENAYTLEFLGQNPPSCLSNLINLKIRKTNNFFEFEIESDIFKTVKGVR